MSAPTVLDAGALVTGLAWQARPAEFHDDSPEVDFTGEEQRSRTRLAQLTRQHNELCTQAVDAFEIAAGLEAAGINDRQARTLYGAASVFELAQAMYDLVPTRLPDAVDPPDPWHHPLRQHLLHGLLYGLPGLMYAVALSMLQTGLNVALLVAATIVASGLGQGLSLLGHILMGRGQRDAAGALFRTSLIAAGAIAAIIVLCGRLFGPLPPVVVLAGWQVAYLLAATILMVLEARVLLLAVLTPGVILAVVELSGARDVPRDVVLGVLGLCVVAALVAAWFKLSGSTLGTSQHLRERFGLEKFDITASTAYVVYGIATAGLVSFAVIDALTRGRNSGAGSIALMMLPLVASLGVAEWLVYRLRSRAVTVLRRTSTLEGFRVLARTELVRALLIYLAVLIVLTVSTVFLFPQQEADAFLLSTLAYSVLGLAFLGTTLLLSLRRHVLALGLALAALVTDSVLRMLMSSASPSAIAAMHLVVFSVFLAAVIPTVASHYTSAGAHR